MVLDFSHGSWREDQGAAAAAPYLSIDSVGRRCRGTHGSHRPALQHAPLSVAALCERRKKSEGRRGYRPPQLLLQEMSKLQALSSRRGEGELPSANFTGERQFMRTDVGCDNFEIDS